MLRGDLGEDNVEMLVGEVGGTLERSWGMLVGDFWEDYQEMQVGKVGRILGGSWGNTGGMLVDAAGAFLGTGWEVAGKMLVGKIGGILGDAGGGFFGGRVGKRWWRRWGECWVYWGHAGGLLGKGGDVGRVLGRILGTHSQGLVGLDMGAQAEAQGLAALPHALGVALHRRPVQGQRRGGQLLQGGSQPRAGAAGRGHGVGERGSLPCTQTCTRPKTSHAPTTPQTCT